MSDGRPGLKHLRNHKIVKPIASFGERTEKGFVKTTQASGFRRGACENCGAMSHKTRDCCERPRKKTAKMTGENICPDEIVVDDGINFDYDGKRDHWKDYNIENHEKLIKCF